MRKGEKGITISAPIVSRTRVYVFDIAQTDGEELPVSKLDGAGPNSLAPTDSVEDIG